MLMPEDLRVLLWDIDGTLVRSRRPGAFQEYTAPVLEGVFGTAGRLAELKVSGMTDLQIVSEALRDEGFTPERIRERAVELRERYMAELERVVANARVGEEMFHALPGAREALAAADAHPRYLPALLTGNLEPAARFKLRLVGLLDFFKLPGAFGDDSHDRRDLPALAASRIQKHLGRDLKPSQFVVIGDTPNDIACARHFGARVVGVGTGRGNGVEALRPHAPDALLPDLTDADLLMRTLARL